MDNLPNLPHLIVEEPKRSKATVFAIIFISLVILAIPVGVYLVSRTTQSKSQAALVVNTPETSLTLKNNPTLEGPAVEIRMKSDFDTANAVAAKIHFDPKLVQVQKIATSSSIFTKWIESSIDESQGVISLSGGVPGEGVKTQTANKDGAINATIFYQGRDNGQTALTFDNDAALFRGTDNLNILKTKNGLTLTVLPGVLTTEIPIEASTSAKTSFLNPKGGETFSYFKPMLMVWTLPDFTKVDSITLFLNGQSLGPIVEGIANQGSYTWIPQTSVPLPYINDKSVFQLQISSMDKGKTADFLSGPFSLSLANDIAVSSSSAQLKLVTDFKMEEISPFLSGFYQDKPAKYDLNSDGVINDVDLWLLRNMLIEKQIIKG